MALNNKMTIAKRIAKIEERQAEIIEMLKPLASIAINLNLNIPDFIRVMVERSADKLGFINVEPSTTKR